MSLLRWFVLWKAQSPSGPRRHCPRDPDPGPRRPPPPRAAPRSAPSLRGGSADSAVGRSRWIRRRWVPSPSGASRTSTVLPPGSVGVLALPAPGEDDAGGRIDLDVLAAGDVAPVHVAVERAAGPRVRTRRAAHPLDHLVGVDEEVEDGLRACRDSDLHLDRGLCLCACHVCPSSAAPARRPASAARDDRSRTGSRSHAARPGPRAGPCRGDGCPRGARRAGRPRAGPSGAGRQPAGRRRTARRSPRRSARDRGPARGSRAGAARRSPEQRGRPD